MFCIVFGGFLKNLCKAGFSFSMGWNIKMCKYTLVCFPFSESERGLVNVCLPLGGTGVGGKMK